MTSQKVTHKEKLLELLKESLENLQKEGLECLKKVCTLKQEDDALKGQIDTIHKRRTRIYKELQVALDDVDEAALSEDGLINEINELEKSNG